jgi:hypothetical protein
MYYTPYEKNTFFDKVENEEGDSNIYVGISYLRIVARQIDLVREAERSALMQRETFLFLWLNEMKVFRDLIENRTGLNYSDKKVKLFEYALENNQLVKKDLEVEEKQKYNHLFAEIEKMIERTFQIQKAGGSNPFLEKRYINEKKILEELGECWRQLMIDANRRHLIMPEGMKDMKALVKQEWIDREAKKEF